jgi:hypothetical protein
MNMGQRRKATPGDKLRMDWKVLLINSLTSVCILVAILTNSINNASGCQRLLSYLLVYHGV